MTVYEIRVKGHLDPTWSEWFDGLKITNTESGETVLSGEIADQAALHGVLNKVRDLGLSLLAVNSGDPSQSRPRAKGAQPHHSQRNANTPEH